MKFCDCFSRQSKPSDESTGKRGETTFLRREVIVFPQRANEQSEKR